MSDALSINQQAGIGRWAQSLLLPLALVAFIVMMVVPIPPFLLDIFFTANIVISLSILMVSVNMYRPLDFSAFPTILLFATILRLALNVASTRVVLVHGHEGTAAAGHVIESFGEFVIGGNFVVGILVFIILMVINLVVIVKGTGRVSEVAARFTLDAMPGKQMAIDADLNAGIITAEVARKRREEVARESDFYGSMDGATKFVKGDAIAGILILLVNIIGGLIIGLLQHGLSASEAASTYVTLTIGDGLVAQIPSLLLSIATAVIVTRESGESDLSKTLSRQIGARRAWYPVAGILALIGILPGMPNFLFLAAAAGAAAIAHFVNKRDKKEAEDLALEAAKPNITLESSASDEEKNEVTISDVANTTPLLIEVGYGLIPLIEDATRGALVSRITGIRKQVSRDLGFIVPQVRIRDNLSLMPSAYRITIAGAIAAEDQVINGKLLAIQGTNSNVVLPGQTVKDPTFGLDAVWIDPSDKPRALAADYTVVDAGTVIATHLHQLLMQRGADLLGQDDVQEIIDHFAKSAPNLVQGVVPKIVSLPQLTQVLKSLVAEQIPISDMKRILEAVSSAKGRETDDLIEAARIALGPILIQRISSPKEELPIVTLDTGLEQLMIQNAKQNGAMGNAIEPGLARKLIEAFEEQSNLLAKTGKTLVVVTTPILRRELASLVRQAAPDGLVLSFKELPETKRVNVVAIIGGAS
ncbi:MAG: flagellar biosynthesis protein FlhA [Hyphomicrobiales bacterium]|nr:flagellar biosynthesis protein FlhA [Hyphomicrobiales bacterium]